jgi:hypothetical protein
MTGDQRSLTMSDLPPIPPGMPVPPVKSNREKPTKVLDLSIQTEDEDLNHNEVNHILQTTLIVQHRNDPNILRFIAAYMKCRNTAQAAREAGLPVNAGRNLRNKPDIHAAIEALTSKSLMKHGFDAEEVVERVKEIAGVDPLEFMEPDGTVKPLDKMSDEARRAIKSFTVRETWGEDMNGMRVQDGRIVKIELWSKEKALEFLGREKGLFKETKKVEHDVTRNMANILLESKARAEERKLALEAPKDVIEITGKVDAAGGVEDAAE